MLKRPESIALSSSGSKTPAVMFGLRACIFICEGVLRSSEFDVGKMAWLSSCMDYVLEKQLSLQPCPSLLPPSSSGGINFVSTSLLRSFIAVRQAINNSPSRRSFYMDDEADKYKKYHGKDDAFLSAKSVESNNVHLEYRARYRYDLFCRTGNTRDETRERLAGRFLGAKTTFFRACILDNPNCRLNVPFTGSHVNANEPIPSGHMRHSLKRTSSLFSAYSHQDNIASTERFAWHSDQFGSARNRRGRFYVPLHLTPLRSLAVLSLRWIILYLLSMSLPNSYGVPGKQLKPVLSNLT
ncbi:putative syntaxin-8B [Fusarium oxysporum f. sp. albedinis]|nr:putative syntaxin-8B [Fusarium oxysporum f. sp. albedinis]